MMAIIRLVQLVVPILIAILAGNLLVSLLLQDSHSRRPFRWIQFWLSVGIGLGIMSASFFIWLQIASLAILYFVAGELVLLITAFIILSRTQKSLWSDVKEVFAHQASLNTKPILAWVFYFATVLSIGSFILGSIWRPHGGWDAWAIWNLSARFLYRGGGHWQNAFSNIISHPDYPLLIPTNVARMWSYLGNEAPLGAMTVAFIFTISTFGFLVTSLTFLRGHNIGYIGGLTLLIAPAFIVHGPTQSADIPLAFYMLIAIVMIYIHDQTTMKGRGLLVLAGIAIGLATWTKNEGWLFLSSLLAARFIVHLFNKTIPSYIPELRDFCFGLMPILLIVLGFKFIFAPANDLVVGQGAQTLERLVDVSRYSKIGLEFFWQAIRLEAKFATPIVILPFILLVFGVKSEQIKKPGLITPVLVLAIMLTGYFLIFLTTPHQLDWHLRTANYRLFLQLWPMMVFMVMMLIAAPRLETPSEQV